MQHRLPGAWPFVVVALTGCAGAPRPPTPEPAPELPASAPAPPGAVEVAFTLPRGGEPSSIFALPWPTELLRKADGRPDFRGFPGRDTLAFGAYLDAAEADVEGYSLAPTIYFHFTGPLAAPRLPASPEASASAASPVFLVDVDPASPERGAFIPIEQRLYGAAQRYVPAHTLAVKPVPGVVLRPGTLYAAVVTRALGGPSAELGTPRDLEILTSARPHADPQEERARLLHEGPLDLLGALGVARARLAAVALFRTHAPHLVTARLLEVITHLPPGAAPRVLAAAWTDARARRRGPGGYLAIEGTYCTPNFQSGIEHAPFLAIDGGGLALDADGRPRVIDVPAASRYHSRACGGSMRARFVLTVPVSPMPPEGYPLMISAHGTGGDAETFLGARDFAGWAAREGIAVVSTDQPLHGGEGPAPRPGSLEPIALDVAGIPIPLFSGPRAGEVAFYNPIHPAAARDNLRQAAADTMVLARLLTSIDLGPLLARRPQRDALRFDAGRVLVAGHSQGSQSMAAVGAVDPMVRGVILSGCGGDARLGILRRADLEVKPLFAAMLGLAPGELDEFHPFMTLVQMLADPIDPGSYARFYWEPLPGRRPQSVLHFEGLADSFVPAVTAEALAVALHAVPLSPVVQRVPGLAGEGALTTMLAAGGATRAFAQLRATRHEDGHFVLFHEPGAAELAMEFMRAVVARE